MRPARCCHTINYRPQPARWKSNLLGSASLEKSVPLLTKLGVIYRIAEGDNLADGFEELNAEEMDIAGVLLALDSGLDRRHAGGD
jgi:hypothetical protein